MMLQKKVGPVGVIIISIAFGLLFWVADSIFEYAFFHQNLSLLLLDGPENFYDALILKMPLRTLFVRCSFLTGATLGGIALAFFLGKKAASDAALKASEEKYRNIFQTARDALILCSADGKRILDVNPSACKLYGYERDEMLALGPDHLMAGFASNFISAETHRSWIPLQYQKKKDGTLLPTEISASIGHLHGSKIYTAVIRDISERVRSENDKEQLEAQLHRAQKMEALGTLAGGVAHDLNNILSALVGYPDLLLMDLSDDSPLRGPLLTIQKSGQKAADIVQDLLTLARRGVMVNRIVNLNTIVSDYINSLEFTRFRISFPQVSIELSLEGSLHNIMGSPVHLSKTVMNIVTNAFEAIVGAGRVSVSTENITMDTIYTGYEPVQKGSYVRLRVEDSGIGLSKEDFLHIFEPFYTKKVMGKSGTGLGMAVVWGSVKDHRGYIDLKPGKERGTICELYFPITGEAMPDKSTQGAIEHSRGTETILVVDDMAEQREIIGRMLERLGYTVVTCPSGEAAVEYLKDHSVNLVVLDMIMDPGIDGLETYRRMRAINPLQKAIISSGFSETDRVREARRIGAGTYIRKPYVLGEIAKAVRAELDRPETPPEEVVS